ncbi:MAG: ABC transporter ATP-binding protein [Planctomycetota bacterium]
MTAAEDASPSEANSPTTVSTEPVFACRSLTKRFRDFWLRTRVTAVSDLDFEVHRGEVVGLLGPNGSGKSTTIKMILGLLFPTSGQIELFGRAPTDVAIKSRVGYLPEETHLYPFLDARETLDFYGRLFGIPRPERKQRIDQLVDMVGLAGAQRRRVGEYSKGMQRRIGLAQALINDPDLLILDEPTSGLDPIGTRQVKDLLVELSDQGKTLLLSSHLLADAEDVCSRIVVMFGGKILAEGTVEQLLAVPEELILRTDRLNEATLNELKTLLDRSGHQFLGSEQPRQRLEERFLELVTQATAEGRTTSGAGAGTRLASFLGGDGAKRELDS